MRSKEKWANVRMSEFNKDQIVIPRPLNQSISGAKAVKPVSLLLVDCYFQLL